ncbi:Alpha-monoglucosyldiacylglycerol synthase [Fundidesulfovibrio magnetotacticus]|uniref:Alpha-monoglucosyldiacylglycerol synthase n=1 Tax=Fundidesulfovibrio magnetotacticus TaxID=2730080 RepID=A0A6V8LTJ4_9BACT|nr:glycosyltransferase family 4 protein [Fundidesulfovibrio magnetotacticus]GFK93901.1 Alpha-monoglucosyldiacylglycerol synthase [Fundidesulfovibrio magnetotacticus]
MTANQGEFKAHVVHLSFSGDFGGREKAASWLCRAMRQEGVFSMLYIVVETRNGSKRNSNLFNALGDTVSLCRFFQTHKRFSFSLVSQLYEALLEYDASILHCHCYKSLFYALLLKFTGRFSGPVVYTLHGIELPFGFGATLIKAFQRIGLHFADGVVGCSREVLERTLPKRKSRPHMVIVNAIDVPLGGFESAREGHTDARTSLARTLGFDQTRPLVINIGRLCPQKNFHLFLQLIKCLSGMKYEGPEAMFLIAGEGPLRAELEAETDRLDIRNNVHFAGFVTDMDRLYRAADLLIQTSTWEGTPMCLLEARAHGLPVIAPAVGGNVDVVRDGLDGTLYPVNDLAALTRASVSYLCDQNLREEHGRMAFEHTRHAFDPGRWARRHFSFYHQLRPTFRLKEQG